MEIKQIEDEKLESLAQDPDNIVYRYTDSDRIQDNVMPLTDVKDTIMELWNVFKPYVKQNLSYPEVRKLRRKLIKKNIKWANFSKSHPLIFDRVVDHRTGEPEIKALLYMIFLKEMNNKKQINNGAEQLRKYIFDTFSMSEKEYRANNVNANIIDPMAQA
jgi:hypothetical protein